MAYRVLFFAGLREKLGTAHEDVSADDGVRTVACLRDQLAARGGDWAMALGATPNLRAAVNQRMVDMDAPLRDGDEVAFFPPVTGG